MYTSNESTHQAVWKNLRFMENGKNMEKIYTWFMENWTNMEKIYGLPLGYKNTTQNTFENIFYHIWEIS